MRVSRRSSRVDKLVSKELDYLDDLHKHLSCFWYYLIPISNIIIFSKSLVNWEKTLRTLGFITILSVFGYFEMLLFLFGGIMTYFFISYYRTSKLDPSTLKKKLEELVVKEIFEDNLEKYELPDDITILNVSLDKFTAILLSIRSVFSGNSRYNFLISVFLLSLGVINFYTPLVELFCQIARCSILVFSIALFIPSTKVKILKFPLFRNNISKLHNFLVVEKNRPKSIQISIKEEEEILKKEHPISKSSEDMIQKNNNQLEINPKYLNPDIQGYLYKQGNSHKGYQKRYFLLKGNIIYYFKNQNCFDASGIIYLNQCSDPEITESPKKNSFQIEDFHICRTYKLLAENETQRNQWIEAIKRSIAPFKAIDKNDYGTFKKMKMPKIPFEELKKLTAQDLLSIGAPASGTLSKQGKIVQNWRSRLFVLYGLELFYYKSKDSTPIGAIHLQGSSITVDSHQDNLFRIRDQIAKREYCLIAENKEEREKWIQTISKAIQPEEAEEEVIRSTLKKVDIKPTPPTASDPRHMSQKSPHLINSIINRDNSNEIENNSENQNLSVSKRPKQWVSYHTVSATKKGTLEMGESKLKHKTMMPSSGYLDLADPNFFNANTSGEHLEGGEKKGERIFKSHSLRSEFLQSQRHGQLSANFEANIQVKKQEHKQNPQENSHNEDEKRNSIEAVSNQDISEKSDGVNTVSHSDESNSDISDTENSNENIIINTDCTNNNTIENKINNNTISSNINQNIANNNNDQIKNIRETPRWNSSIFEKLENQVTELTSKAGYLFKKGEKRKNWQKRYFILKNYKLSYYKALEDKECKGEIDLRVCEKAKTSDDKKKPFCFSIFNRATGREYVMSASDINDRRLWIHSINQTVMQYQPHFRKTQSQIPDVNADGTFNEKSVVLSTPTHTGYVEKKKTQLVSKWQRRFFVLSDGVLSSYESHDDHSKPKTVFDVNLLEISDTIPNREKEHCFILTIPKDHTSYTISVATKEEKDLWIKRLKQTKSQFSNLEEQI